MGNREDTGPNNQERQRDRRTPLAPAPAQPAPNPDQPHGNNIHGDPDPDPQQPIKWFQSPDWYMVILTALLFAVGVATVVIFHKQFTEMTKQTRLLNTQAQQAATDSVEAARKVERQLAIAQSQAKAANDTAEAARISAEISQRQVRAYMNLSVPKIVPPLLWYDAKLQLILGTLIFTNSGQSPAKDVITIQGAFLDRLYPTVADNCKRARHLKKSEASAPSKNPVGPQSIASMAIRVSDPSQNGWNAIQGGAATVCAFGSVFYDDIFGDSHETEFCLFYLNVGNWGDCATHNAMYDYPKKRHHQSN